MHYYNGLTAAKRIGISYKTLLRHIEKGKITPEEGKTPTGQLVISEDQVEAARLEIQRERDMLRHAKTVLPDRQIEADIDIETRMASMAQSIANLNATVASQTRRIGELTMRVAQLEAQASLHVPVPQPTTSTLPPNTKPQNRNVVPSTDLPDGSIGLADFASQHGISLSSASRWARNGDIATTQRQRAGRPQHFLTQKQQEQALEWMRKNGKLDMN